MGSFVENVNKLSLNLDTIVTANSIFDDSVLPVLQEVADLDLQEVTSDLRKGNYLGNRKIDIDLSLNRAIVDSPVSYYKAELILTDGQVVPIAFMGGGSTMELTSHSDIRNYIVNDAMYQAMVEYTECTYEEAIGTNQSLLRFRDADGHSSNIERVILHSFSGSPIEPNPIYFWAKTTSALQTIANRIGDIIALGNDVENIVTLAQRIDELNELQSKLDDLMTVFVNLNSVTTVAAYSDEINNLASISGALTTLSNNLATLQNLNTNIASVQNVSTNMSSVKTVANKDLVIQDIYNNMAMLQTTHDNMVAILQADYNATLASTKASEASTSAASAVVSANTATTQAGIATTKADIATARANEIKGITAQATTGAAGTAANVAYNSMDGKFTFLIPQGIKGDKGDAFVVNAVGAFANRPTYNTQPAGFTYVATDLGQIYFKNSATSGDWSVGSPFGKGDTGATGATGNGISSIVRIAGNGGSGVTDTYRITYTSGGTFDFYVYNGADSDIDSTDLSAHTTNTSNPHSVTKTQVGLGSVNNTADSTKAVLSATKLATTRAITLTGDVTGTVNFDGSAPVSMTTAVGDNTHSHGDSTITDVAWSKISSKPDPVVTVTLTGDVTGTANATLTDLGNGTVTVATTIAANSVALGTDTTGNYVAGITNGSYITTSGTAGEGWSPTIAVDATSANIASKVVARDTSGNFSAGTITATLSGNASTATTLANSVNINGVSFNGSTNISIEDRLGTSIASDATVTIGTAGLGDYIHITGTTTITSFGTAASAGIRRTLIFDGALTLTHNATSLICVGGVSIVTVAGMVIEVVAETTANWRVVSITHPSISATELGYLDGVTSSIQTQFTGKQATLVSGTNIKTINSNSILGSGDLVIASGISLATANSYDLGVGQTWQNVTASRALGTTYTNSTGKPIMVGVGCYSAGIAGTVQPTVNGIVLPSGADYGEGGVYFIVPNGATYSIYSTQTLKIWAELR